MTQSGLLSSGKVTRLIRRFQELRIAVLGDAMLDEYLRGRVDRASPEAPVPLVAVDEESSRLGGAAHVANLVATLGAKAFLGGAVGDDDAGRRLLQSCAEAGIETSAVLTVHGRPTIRKVRVLAQHQQVLRLDWEDPRQLAEKEALEAVETFRANGPFDAVILSDYAKGFLSQRVLRDLIEIGRRWSVPVLVDPKSSDFFRYRGASVITPNLKEFEAATGKRLPADRTEAAAALQDGGSALLAISEAKALVVTLGEKGMALVTRDAPPFFIPASAREVYDVSGAGDTVIAVLALGMAAGLDLQQAAGVANEAAGIAVGRSGVAVIEPAELAARFAPKVRDKILTRQELKDRVAWWRLRGQRIVFTNGCFDLLHVGHVSLLRQAAEEGDVLVVAINSDDSVKRLKGPDRPLITGAERATLLAALDSVDAVVEFSEDTPLELLEEVLPDVLAKGADYSRDQVVGRELVENAGGRVALIPLVEGRSTSKLMERIRGGK